MIDLLTQQHKNRAAVAMLLAGAALAVLVGVLAPSGWWAALPLLAAVGLVARLVSTRSSAIFVGRADSPQPRPTARFAAFAPAAQRSVTMQDGTARSARVVPLAQEADLQLVLTVRGYALVDQEGRVVHSLKAN